MSKSLVYMEYETITWVNGSGSAVVSGKMVVVGTGMVGIAKVDIANGASGAVFIRGVHKYTRLTGGSTAWTVNIPIYYDAPNNRLTKAVTAAAIYAGVAHKATVDGDAEGEIVLNQRIAAAAVANGSTVDQLLTALRAAGVVIAS